MSATSIRAVGAADLPMILAWRNDPAIRRVMLSQHEITLAEHQQWFARARADPARRLLLVADAGTPIGFVQFHNVADGGIADWGFYAAPDAPRGTGRKLGTAALDHAFRALHLHKVCGQALDHNAASIAFHERLGFVREGVLRDQHRVNGHYHALVCFGLLAEEWQSL